MTFQMQFIKSNQNGLIYSIELLILKSIEDYLVVPRLVCQPLYGYVLVRVTITSSSCKSICHIQFSTRGKYIQLPKCYTACFLSFKNWHEFLPTTKVLPPFLDVP